MNTKVIIALFCALALASAAAGTVVSCQSATQTCDATSCKGAKDNWTVDGAGCKITNCDNVTAATATGLSDFACASCVAAKPYSNVAATACVASNCAKLVADAAGWTAASCTDCYGSTATLNSDSKGCTVPTSTNGKILAASAIIAATLLL